MAADTITTHKASFSKKGYSTLTSAVSDLAKIGNAMKIVIDKDNVFMYATHQVNNYIMAMKTMLWPTDTLFETNEFTDSKLEFIVDNPKQFAKALGILNEDSVRCALKTKNNASSVREMSANDGGTGVRFIGGMPSIITNLTMDEVSDKMDVAKAQFSFDISEEDYSKMKSFAAMTPTDGIIIRVKNGKVTVSFEDKYLVSAADTTWTGTKIICFDKRYLKSIAAKNGVTVHVFEFFILIVEANSYFMIGLELDKL